MSLGHEHELVLIGLAGPMDVVNLSLFLLEQAANHIVVATHHASDRLI